MSPLRGTVYIDLGGRPLCISGYVPPGGDDFVPELAYNLTSGNPAGLSAEDLKAVNARFWAQELINELLV